MFDKNERKKKGDPRRKWGGEERERESKKPEEGNCDELAGAELGWRSVAEMAAAFASERERERERGEKTEFAAQGLRKRARERRENKKRRERKERERAR